MRNYNELNTSLDIKNNLGRNVLALFDPPHLSKLGKYFMCIQLKSTETSQNYKKSLFPNLNNIFVISRGILNRKKLTYFMEFCLLYSTSVNIKFGKAAVQEKNEDYWMSTFEKTAAYICNLKSNSGKPVLQLERYASFLGIDIL